jgi:nucleoside-diphosphate-sugar epimerase
MNFNVFHAAARLRLRRVVWASSEATLGVPFGIGASEMSFSEAEGLLPRYAPVDEDHDPLATMTTYALSKLASELIARQIATWSGIPFVALRISSMMDSRDYEDSRRFGRIPRRASGTCGGMWTPGTWRPPAAWRSRRRPRPSRAAPA